MKEWVVKKGRKLPTFILDEIFMNLIQEHFIIETALLTEASINPNLNNIAVGQLNLQKKYLVESALPNSTIAGMLWNNFTE